MKKLYTLSLCAFVSLAVAGAVPGRFVKQQHAKKTHRALVIKKAAPGQLWRPASATQYMFEDGEWLEMAVEEFEYDSRGNLIKATVNEDGFVNVIEDKYDDNNMLVERLEKEGEEGGELTNASKRVYVYDPIVKDYYIERMGYNWDDGEWIPNYFCENNKITRDDAGNILEIVKELPFMDKMTPAYKSAWHYDSKTGKADEYYYYSNQNADAPQWELYDLVSYKNIEWDRTDGQMTDEITELLTGANRVKYADVYYNDALDGHIIVTYSGENDYVFKNTLINPAEVAQEVIYETIDENGSFKVTENIYLDDDYNLLEEPFATAVETVVIDAHGNMIEDTVEETYGDEMPFVMGEKHEYEYDANGNPTQVTISVYDMDEEVYIAESRTVYGEYIDAAGVGSITVDGNEPVEYFNLQGVRVDNPAGGLYIRRQGSDVRKIIIK